MPSLRSFCVVVSSSAPGDKFWLRVDSRDDSTYQGLHGAVESVTVVAAELGVNTLEGGVTVGLGLLDTVRRIHVSVLVMISYGVVGWKREQVESLESSRNICPNVHFEMQYSSPTIRPCSFLSFAGRLSPQDGLFGRRGGSRVQKGVTHPLR